MNLLAIDTVTEMASVALLSGEDILSEQELVPKEHTRVILPMIKQAMARTGISFSQLDAIAFSRGPGSFTGLRICASITQGLAIAYGLPVIPVSSLASLAQGSFRLDGKTNVIACLDARRHEVYWGAFIIGDNDMMHAMVPESVIAPQDARTEPGMLWHGVGSGFATYQKELAENPHVNVTSSIAERFPLAQDMLPYAKIACSQGKVVDASLAIPTYLRDNIAKPRQAENRS
ncbi:MAG: tRNA (adenosine(37)-N6)-threonylcarbamoyltransferase complex dimerization subunit type 1 TsaB [Thioalkalispiraceae bacterium]|jgi:tRNA threonylcarbamoyladenosine biosynthesis protein TsaB